MRSETMASEWNEQLSFVELFLLLTRGLRLQPRGDAPLVDAALATHVLDLTQISHSGGAGKCIQPTLAALPPRALSAQGPAPDGKPHPPDPAQFRKSGLCQLTTLLQADPSLHSPTCPQTTAPTLGLVLLTRILITAEYPVIIAAQFFLQIYLQENKP